MSQANGDQSIRAAHLIDELDVHHSGRDEEATAELIGLGTSVLPNLIERAATLSPSGQLCAIEVFRTLGASESEATLVRLLSSTNNTVRSSAAEALGQLGMVDAVPHLRELLARSRRAGTAPDDHEPVSVRHALTALGARMPVVPTSLEDVGTRESVLGIVVEQRHLIDALDSLGAADQVVAYFQRWRPWKKSWSRVDGTSIALDWNDPWATLVRESQRQAKAAAASLSPMHDNRHWNRVAGYRRLAIDLSPGRRPRLRTLFALDADNGVCSEQ